MRWTALVHLCGISLSPRVSDRKSRKGAEPRKCWSTDFLPDFTQKYRVFAFGFTERMCSAESCVLGFVCSLGFLFLLWLRVDELIVMVPPVSQVIPSHYRWLVNRASLHHSSAVILRLRGISSGWKWMMQWLSDSVPFMPITDSKWGFSLSYLVMGEL